MKTILVPLDGSPLAEQVLPYVRVMARLLNARIELLHVVSEVTPYHRFLTDVGTIEAGEVVRPAADTQPWEVMRKRMHDHLLQTVATLRMEGFHAGMHILHGDPAEKILMSAERENATMIAMATHGYGGFQRWALGSVTDKIVRAACIPVLVVRSSEPIPMLDWNPQRILLPLDGSACSRQAIPLAVELAAATKATLLPMMVIAPPLMEEVEIVAQANAASSALRKRLLTELDLVENALIENHVAVEPIVATGPVADTIVAQSEQQDADLIVMATHGASGLRRWALGSIADKLLRTSTAPLLIVRARDVVHQQQAA